jgi:REP element-mobilizing transposase RayT
MADSYTSLFYHLIFSTKNRETWLDEEVRTRLYPYLGGIARTNRWTSLAVGGAEDHTHMLVLLPPSVAVAKAVQLLKGGSSHWLHETMPGKTGGWQDGYGAFSVSRSMVEDVKAYIAGQLEHHRQVPFMEEYRTFLQRHGIEVDERYIWG